MNDSEISRCLNHLNKFLSINTYNENKHYDVILLLGNAISSTAIDSYKLFLKGNADYFMIAGGRGHTTDILQSEIQKFLKKDYGNASEAYMMSDLIKTVFNVNQEILLEENSTNCNENIRYAIKILKDKKINCQNILLCHDPLMQKRIDVTANSIFSNISFDNFASFIPEVKVENYNISFLSNKWGLWSNERYISLLLGEMYRLIDNEDGYGPNGKNFINHVDIDQENLRCYQNLLKIYGYKIRK